MKDSSRKKILIIDPEKDIAELFARALESHREYECYMASSREDAVDLLSATCVDLLLMDAGMAAVDGFSFIPKTKKLCPKTIIFIDGYLHQKEVIAGALSQGAHGHFIKPIKVDDFRKRMDEVLSSSI